MSFELSIPAERRLPHGRLEVRRRHLVQEVAPRSQRRTPGQRRRTWLLPAGGLAAAACAAAVAFVGVGGNGGESASAATALRDAAAVARTQPSPIRPGPGEYVYTRQVNAYLSVFPEGDAPFAALVPRVEELWLGFEGGRVRQTSGRPTFLSERDRENWIAAGRPALREPAYTGPYPAPERLELPLDPDRLYERLEREALGHSEGVHPQMFTLVGDALRDGGATPAQRAALYEVAARIPGVELLGEVTDPAGRPGVAVAMRQAVDGLLHTLVFDPETAALLAEEQRTLAENEFGYPEGTVIGYSMYHEAELVDSKRERPAAAL
jgi:hypothetical protein